MVFTLPEYALCRYFYSMTQMKKSILFGGIVLCALFIVHLFWFSKTVKSADFQFDHTVSVALYEVADTMSEHAVVEKKSDNYFFVTVNAKATNEEIDTLIRREFSKRAIALDYEIGIYNAEDDSLIHGKYVEYPSLVPQFESGEERDDVQKNFAVLFSGRGGEYLTREEFWIQILILISLFSTTFFYGFNYLKSADEKTDDRLEQAFRLNNTLLDYHNQLLHVKGETHKLTYKENQILKLLFEKPNEVIERDEFLNKVWEKDGFFVARSMDVFISRIRKYLREDSSLKIENLRSIGYKLSVNPKG